MSPRQKGLTYTVDAAGFAVSVTLSEAEIDAVHHPLTETISRLTRHHRRPIVLLAGPSGSGKTTLAHVWRRLAIDRGVRHPWTVLSMDGFHLPHRTLFDTTVILDNTKVPLTHLKGAPASFDLAGLTEKMTALASGADVSWPDYDRNEHDPIPDAIEVPDRGVVMVEGLYMLLARPGWRELRGLAQLGIFVEVPLDLAQTRVVARHRRGGRSRAEAEEHWRRSDRVNTQLVTEYRHGVDVLLSTDLGGRMQLRSAGSDGLPDGRRSDIRPPSQSQR